jgi:uncharacterized membrane protein
MKKSISSLFTSLFIVFIITIPAFLSILNSNYFSMHDDQHIARLYLLVTGIRQWDLFPRWVDMLGFGHGYPLFNFYPPLIYYVSAVFYFLGFSLIWSIKLMIISGFLISASGIYFLVKKMAGRIPALFGAAVYTYFLYHSITVYVRGALAEFYSLAVLPFVFLSLYNLSKKLSYKNLIMLGISFALLVLTHPLIAFPSLIFIGMFFIFLFFQNKEKIKFSLLSLGGGILALGLSAFFWLPSMVERKYTLIDNILTKELANYKDHFVYPSQLWYSPWGYGGSTPGTADGMTFQLGKLPIIFVVLSLFFGLLYFLKRKKLDATLKIYVFILFSLFISIFMMTEYSSFIWDRISFLWYIQFPWRFLTFTNLFVAVSSAFSILFVMDFLKTFDKKKSSLITGVIAVIFVVFTIFKYSQYFKPQRMIATNDRERTSFKEIAWRISGTSYEFVPSSVRTKKTKLGTTTLAINENELTEKKYQIVTGKAEVKITKDTFAKKEFKIIAGTNIVFQLNTYNFPGWQAVLDGKEIKIDDKNDLTLINVSVPKGQHKLTFSFMDTKVRTIGDLASVLSLVAALALLLVSSSRKNK